MILDDGEDSDSTDDSNAEGYYLNDYPDADSYSHHSPENSDSDSDGIYYHEVADSDSG
ncbi:MAG: hypothetical protein BJ554DRAFT_847 [Olpidium bornovanus]|uniref:Uncharacterized protein n=1 Tax=Olpidium bornovanus TaxID=278681 RepID=A0A8H7ZTA1_9FUNG|nr:MAG: hypothetical protein BJ554DRAFT_847 [Olpidium bornovanus]